MIFQIRTIIFCIAAIFLNHTKYIIAASIAAATNIKNLCLNSFISMAPEKLVKIKYRKQHTCIMKMTRNIFFINGHDLFKMDNLFQVTNFLQYKC